MKKKQDLLFGLDIQNLFENDEINELFNIYLIYNPTYEIYNTKKVKARI